VQRKEVDSGCARAMTVESPVLPRGQSLSVFLA
jgi:hypothetical protein